MHKLILTWKYFLIIPALYTNYGEKAESDNKMAAIVMK